MIRPRHFGWIVLFTTLAGCATVAQKSGGADATYESEVSGGLEEIFVTRTTRTQFVPGATPACAAAPFTSASEQHYDLWSLAVQSSNAKVVKTHDKRVGEFVACFGAISNGSLPMYSRGVMGSIAYASVGDCRFMQAKPPAPKLIVLNCSGDLSELPDGYVGGFLTASTLAPTGGKDAVNVRGYLSTSVITMRFWRKPT
jgi:hypothetical protein